MLRHRSFFFLNTFIHLYLLLSSALLSPLSLSLSRYGIARDSPLNAIIDEQGIEVGKGNGEADIRFSFLVAIVLSGVDRESIGSVRLPSVPPAFVILVTANWIRQLSMPAGPRDRPSRPGERCAEKSGEKPASNLRLEAPSCKRDENYPFPPRQFDF